MYQNRKMDKIEMLEFCKYCYVEERYPHDKTCRYNDALLQLDILIKELKKG